MNIKLNLNDFKAVLGKTNDGVVTVNDSGKLVKTKFGNALHRAVTKMPATDPQKNRAIREMLVTAVRNSPEGKALGSAVIDDIRRQLGLSIKAKGNTLAFAERKEVAESDLSRKQIDEILARVQVRHPGHKAEGERLEKMLDQDKKLLTKCGLYNKGTTDVSLAHRVD